jgi:sugar lactone lactonase YvrE
MESTTSRRGFIAALGTPMILGATNKSGSKLPVLGEGAYKYEVIHDWGELPANIKYGNTHGVCEDSQGHIYIHHTVNQASESHDTMVVFDAKGKFVKSWGKDFKGGAHGLHINKEGKQEFLYLCDTKRALVVKTTLSGEEVFTIGYPKESEQYKPDAEGKKKKYSPTNLAIAPNGDIYVGDGYGSSYINQYNPKGEYIRTFGGLGAAAGQLSCPHGITVDTRGKDPILTVADRSNKRLQNFTLDGKHINFVEGVSAPCHFSERKGIFVIPDLDSRVTLMDQNNKVIEHLGADDPKTARAHRTQPRDTFTPGKFVCPHGASWDHKGNIFVVEWVEVGRVTKLRKV